MAPLLDTESASQILPLVLKLSNDKIPNVRFNAARVLEKLGSKIDKAMVKSHVKPCLDKLMADSDADVKFYSERAVAAL